MNRARQPARGVPSSLNSLLGCYHAGALLGKLPTPEQLEELQEFQDQPAVPAQQEWEKAGMNNQPKAVLAATKQSTSTMVMLGVGLPALHKKHVDKIEAGEYIDFTELPPARGKSRSILPAVEGQVLVVQAVDLLQSRRVIPDLATWLQCFAIYAAVIASKQPSCLPDLLAYMSIIAKASQKFLWPSWVVYDQNFRQEAASCGNSEWARVDPGIYAQCFTDMAIGSEGWCKHCQSIEHTSERCPLVPAYPNSMEAGLQGRIKSQRRPGAALVPPPQKRVQMAYPDDYRIKFNRFKGDCKFGKACRFPHVCSACKGPHPVSMCDRVRNAEPTVSK